MKVGKIAMILGYGLFLLLAAINNTLSPKGAYGAVAGVVGMGGTFHDPMVMWRAIQTPWVIWMGAAGIVVTEAVAAVMLIIGAGKLWAARSTPLLFNAAKPLALRGLALAACLYLIAFGAVCNEWFMLWQDRTSPNLNEAFRDFVTAMLILYWVEKTDA